MHKLPVNIISGFLGSGKTTAIIRVLEQKPPGESWAIVVNEFGKISIDGQTLQSISVAGSVFDISGGCICCSAKLYLKENLEKIIETHCFDRIIIEPSGLGGIEMVTDMVTAMPKLELMPVICMIDITGLIHMRFQRNLIYQSQIRMADRIVFSKCDLVETPGQLGELLDKFKSLFPDKHSCFTGVNVQTLLRSADGSNLFPEKTAQPLIPAHYLSDAGYVEHAFEFEESRVFNIQVLEICFKENPAVIRAKGHIRTVSGWQLFNYTLSGTNTQPCSKQNTNNLVVIAERSKFDLSEFREKSFF